MDLPREKTMDRLDRLFPSDRRALLLLWLLTVGARLAYTLWDKTGSLMVVTDSPFYYQAGLDFARTGRILYGGSPTALIMPGTPVLIGLLAKVFPDGMPLRYAIRAVWVLIGSLTPLFYYKSVRLYAPAWCAFLVGLVYLHPLHIHIDSYLLTEGPYYAFFAMALYYTLKMGREKKRGDVWKFAFSVLAALLFRANILMLLFFTLLWLLLQKRYTARELLGRIGVVCLVLALFMVPWSIRNYRLFHAFIPVTYGTGNPIMEGTDQGDGYPAEAIFGRGVENIVAEDIVREKNPALFDKNGELLDPETSQYVAHMAIKEDAMFRLRTWLRYETKSFLHTYLWVKPRMILNWVWYWSPFPFFPYEAAHRLRQLNCLFCLGSAGLALALKKHRKVIFFLGFAYVANLYGIAFSLAIDRYAQMIMPYRYLMAGLGLDLAAELLRRRRKPKETP